MSKQLTVELVFNANTQQAKSQMQQLQNSVLQVQNAFNQQISIQGLTSELSKAQSSVNALKTNLNSAFDVNTGKLDLNKFNSNLQKSGMTLKDYRTSLQQLGPEGVRAFNQLSQAVLQGQMPLQKTNGLLNSMMNTFGNSIKWSIAYGAINKVSQGFSNAFQYAKDLNESLNNIRVVTGKSAEEMAKFAEKANRAAKSLASTTTAYTDAALIYYQQGLDGKAVEERAETTLKLANVTGQSAEEISQQLTAVWNNFYDGSKNIEYYADVMTALGAATASSSDEIAQGLEKFAAVADTVGLSYEYATTALATVTAQTRQSADVVGTAFKTLFARIQDLELGETLEDGTTLGLYSEALAKVGVNIKDASGSLKDMDIILNEMGAKWKTIDKDQQVALAKSVAGVRQYTQLIALMDNWDTFEMNLTVAEGAEGTLQEQQDIWAESWEAASNRVKSSAEGIYQSLIDDKFFINLNNILADLLSTFDEFLESIGGLQTLLPMIAGLMLKAFGPAALGAITGFIGSLKGPTTEQQSAASQTRADVLKQQTIMANETGGQVGTAMSQTLPQQKEFLEAIEGINRRLSKSEIERLQYLQAESAELQSQIIAAAELADKLSAENDILKNDEEMARISASSGEQELLNMKPKGNVNVNQIMETANTTMNNAGAIDKGIAAFNANSFTNANGDLNFSAATQELEGLLKLEGISEYAPEIEELGKKGIKSAEDLNRLKGALGKVDATTAAAQKTQEGLNKVFPKGSKAIEKYIKGMTDANKAGAKRVANNKIISRSEENVEQMLKKNKKAMEGYISEAKAMQKVPLGQTIMNIAGGMGQAAAGASMLTSGISNLTEMFKTGEHTLGGWLGAISGIGFALPMLVGGLKSLTAALGINNVAQIMSTNTAYSKIMADQVQRAELGKLVAAENAKAVATMLGISSDQAAIVIKKLKSGATLKETLEELGLAGAKGTGAVATGVLTAATWLQTFAMNALNLSMSPVVAIVLVLTAAIAGLIVVFSFLSWVINAASDAYNKDAIAAEQANKQADLMADKYKTLTEEANKFKEAVTGYEEAQNSLKKLEEGTTEYKEALEETNAKAMELIETYGLWEQFSKQNGLIVFNEGILEGVKNQLDFNAQNANANLNASKIIAMTNQLQADTTQLIRDIGNVVKYTYTDQIRETGQSIQKTDYREFSNTEMQTIINAFGKLTNVDSLTNDKLKTALLNVEKDLSIFREEEINAIIENRHQFEKLAASTKEATEANKAYTKELYNNLIENTQEEKDAMMLAANGDETIYEQIKSAKASRFAQDNFIVNDEGKTLTEALGNIDVSSVKSNDSLEEVAKKSKNQEFLTDFKEMDDEQTARLYAKYILGRDDYNTLHYEGGNGIGTLKSVDGTETYIDQANDEEMRQALARYIQTEDITDEFDEKSQESSKEYNETMSKLVDSGELGKSIIASLQNGVEEADFSQVYGMISSEEEKQELQELSSEELAKKLGLSNEDFITLGYKSAEDFEKAFDEGIAGWTKEAFEAAQQVKADSIIAQAAEKYELDEEVLKKQAALLRKNVEGLEDNAEAAARMAVANQRMNKGVNILTDNWEEWKETLKGTDKTTQDYAEALVEVEAAMRDILNLDEDEIIPTDFLSDTENLDLLEAIGNGSEEAVSKLHRNLFQAQAESLEMSSEIRDNLISIFSAEGLSEVDETELTNRFNTIKNNLTTAVSEMQAELDSLNPGDALSPEKASAFAQALNEYAVMTGMSVEAMETTLAGMDLSADITTKEVHLPQYVTHTTTEQTVEQTGGGLFGPKTYKITETSSSSQERVTPDPLVTVGQINMGEENKGKAPTITVTSPSRGSITSSVTKGGKAAKKNSGGSSSKTATKEKKNRSEEGDFYHDINREIERLAKNTEKLSEAKDRAYGDDKIKNLNAEIAAIEKEVKAQDKLIARAEKKLELDRQALKTYGAKYDKNGEITNYDAMLDAEIKKYNAAVDAYNKKAKLKDADKLSDEEWEKAEEDFEKAEERYSGFEEAVSNYEADLDIKDDAIEEKAAKAREILDKQLEGIQYTVDIQIETNDYDLKVLERLLDQLEDDAFDGAARVANMTKQMDEQFNNIDVYKHGIQQTLMSAGADEAAIQAYMAGDSTAVQGLEFTEEQMNMLQDYTEGIMDSEDAILELREEIENQTMTTFDAWHEKIEENARAFEHATTMAESYKNIIDLVGKTRLDIDDAVLKDLEDTQMQAADGAMLNAKAQMETTQSALDKAKEELAKAKERGNQDDIDKWEEDIETLNQTLMEDQEAFMSSWETALQTAADIFTAQMDRAFEELENSLAGTFKSFDELNAAMERQQQASDRFMDAGKKQYELSKLNRQLQQNLDKTDNAKAQKELLKLQKEIEAYQESGVEMSERDLAALQKKYELRLAEIALEDAQNAKSQVRLTRDSEGNFGYVYTADESNVANAQQNYEDKLEENRQLAIDQNKELSEAIVANRQAMMEALREIRQEDYEDTEAYMQAMETTAQFYKEQEAYLVGETQKVIERSQDIYTNDYLAYDGWSTQKAERGDAYYTAMEERQQIANEIEELKATGQWEKLSETQRMAYEEELRKADEQWLNLQNSQAGAYAVMGANADGWVSNQSLLMDTLGFNILEGITKGDDGTKGTEGLTAALGSAEEGTGFFGASKTAAETWEGNINTIMNNAGIDISGVKGKANEGLGKDGAQKSFVDFQTAVSEALYGKGGTKSKPTDDSVTGAMNTAKSKIDTLKSTAETQFKNVATAVTTWQSTYSGKINTAKNDTNNLNTAIQNLVGKKIEVIAKVTEASLVYGLKSAIDSLNDKTVTVTTNHVDNYTSNGSNSSGNGSGSKPSWDRIMSAYAQINAGNWGTGIANRRKKGMAAGYTQAEVDAAQTYINYIYPPSLNGQGKSHSTAKSLMGYDTGGYTGEWGVDGRLALLHQKEIVLNAHDTENFLAAIKIVRSIADQMNLNNQRLNDYVKTPIAVTTKGEILEQQVTITAEFPNATNHNEIEEAFRNLSTLASQYTNRKN